MKRIIAVLLLVCMLIACRPTPEKDIVSHKDADEMLEKAELNGSAPDAPIRGQYGIPEKLESVTNEGNGHFIVKIDARVEVPDVNALPILRVERDTFSQETVTAVFDRLCKGRTLYRTGSSFMTKARIAEEIVRIEEELNDASLEEDVRAVMQSRIAALKEQYPSAPDGQDERMISDGTMYSYPVTIIDGEPEVLRFGLSLQTDDALPTQHFSVIITDPDNPNTTEGGRDAQKYGRISFLDERSRAGTDEGSDPGRKRSHGIIRLSAGILFADAGGCRRGALFPRDRACGDRAGCGHACVRQHEHGIRLSNHVRADLWGRSGNLHAGRVCDRSSLGRTVRAGMDV